MANLEWKNVSSQLGDYSNAGAVAIDATQYAGTALKDAMLGLAKLYQDKKQSDALQYLSSVRDPNNPLEFNKYIDQTIGVSTGVGADFLKYLGDDYRNLQGALLDAENLRIQKEAGKEAQNAVDRALADANVAGVRRANAALEALNLRSDARTYGDVDPLLNSAAQRAVQGARAAQVRAQTAQLERTQLQQDMQYAVDMATLNAVGDVPLDTPEGRATWAQWERTFVPQIAKARGVSESMAYAMIQQSRKNVPNMVANGYRATPDSPLQFNLTGSTFDLYGNETPFSVPIDARAAFQIPEARAAAQKVVAQGGTSEQAAQVAIQTAQQVKAKEQAEQLIQEQAQAQQAQAVQTQAVQQAQAQQVAQQVATQEAAQEVDNATKQAIAAQQQITPRKPLASSYQDPIALRTTPSAPVVTTLLDLAIQQIPQNVNTPRIPIASSVRDPMTQQSAPSTAIASTLQDLETQQGVPYTAVADTLRDSVTPRPAQIEPVAKTVDSTIGQALPAQIGPSSAVSKSGPSALPPEVPYEQLSQKNKDYLRLTEGKSIDPTSPLAMFAYSPLFNGNYFNVGAALNNLVIEERRAQAKRNEDLDEKYLQEAEKYLPPEQRKQLELTRGQERVKNSYNNLLITSSELNNSIANAAVDPQSQAKLSASFTRAKAAYGDMRKEVESFTRNTIEAQRGNPNKNVVEVLTNVIADTSGFTNTTTESTFSMVPGADGKSITEEELLNIGDKDLINRWAKDKEFSDDEMFLMTQKFKDLTKRFYKELALNPVNGWDKKAFAGAKKLALACIDAATETNGSFKRFFWANNHDYLGAVADEQANLISNALNDPKTQLKENLIKFSQVNAQIAKSQSYYDAMRKAADAAYNAQVQAQIRGATPGVTVYVQETKKAYDRARKNFMDTNNSILGLIANVH